MLVNSELSSACWSIAYLYEIYMFHLSTFSFRIFRQLSIQGQYSIASYSIRISHGFKCVFIFIYAVSNKIEKRFGSFAFDVLR